MASPGHVEAIHRRIGVYLRELGQDLPGLHRHRGQLDRTGIPILTSLWFTYNTKPFEARDLLSWESKDTKNVLSLFQNDRTPAFNEARINYSLSLSSPYVDSFAWERLQTLVLLGVPSSFIIDTLFPRITSIRELRLQLTDTAFDNPKPSHHTTFLFLTEFSVNCVEIVRYMVAPSLSSLIFQGRLNIHEVNERSPGLETMRELIQRSNCRLRVPSWVSTGGFSNLGPPQDHPSAITSAQGAHTAESDPPFNRRDAHHTFVYRRLFTNFSRAGATQYHRGPGFFYPAIHFIEARWYQWGVHSLWTEGSLQDCAVRHWRSRESISLHGAIVCSRMLCSSSLADKGSEYVLDEKWKTNAGS